MERDAIRRHIRLADYLSIQSTRNQPYLRISPLPYSEPPVALATHSYLSLVEARAVVPEVGGGRGYIRYLYVNMNIEYRYT